MAYSCPITIKTWHSPRAEILINCQGLWWWWMHRIVCHSVWSPQFVQTKTVRLWTPGKLLVGPDNVPCWVVRVDQPSSCPWVIQDIHHHPCAKDIICALTLCILASFICTYHYEVLWVQRGPPSRTHCSMLAALTAQQKTPPLLPSSCLWQLCEDAVP